jgi:predicted SAM-dependent methyltransferase
MDTTRILKSGIASLVRRFGYEIRRLRPVPPVRAQNVPVPPGTLGVHYGCGNLVIPGWLNVDTAAPAREVPGASFLVADLAGRHPFADETFALGYAEDFLEHLSQVQSITFLAEAFRTLQPSGVLRLAFPGLETVLRKHYSRLDFSSLAAAQWDAFDKWGHVHFYSREELQTVARHVGFREVSFFSFRQASRPELGMMDSRAKQAELNTYAELTR